MMHCDRFVCTLVLLLSCLQFLSAQELIQSRSHPGIHQLESEAHRDWPVQTDLVPARRLSKTSQTPQVTHEVFGYLPYWKYDFHTQIRYDLVTTIAYFSAEVNANGTVAKVHHWPAASLVQTAHNQGVRVVLVATLFGSGDLQTLLSNAGKRNTCVKQLLDLVRSGNGDGVNIDFEGVPSSQRSNLVTFMQELADSFRTHIPNAHISMASPAVDWSNAWDYRALSEICDALFIMGYNYHWKGSSTAGAVSPLEGGSYNIKSTVTDYLAKTFGNADKIVLGVPYYGIEWPTNSSTAGAATTANGSSRVFASAEERAQMHGKRWHETSKTPWYSYKSSGWHQCWYDDSLSLALKYQYAKSKDLQGIGMWALGYDEDYTQLWGAIADAFATPTAIELIAPVASSIRIAANYPNPANPGTMFRIILDPALLHRKLEIRICNLLGQTVYHTTRYPHQSETRFYWNGFSGDDRKSPSGVYILELRSDQLQRSRRFTLLN